MTAIGRLTLAIESLTHAVCRFRENNGTTETSAILKGMAEMGEKIMSKISEFATSQNAFNDRLDAAVAGVSADIDGLKAEILKLQNTAGSITPEDQALLDGIQARTDAIATKLEALDAATESRPTPPEG